MPRALCLALALVVLAALPAPVVASSNPARVLVVYNLALPASVDVAQYYAARRAVPAANLCPIAPSDPDLVWTFTDLERTVLAPIRACLARLGAANIVHILFVYGTPFRYVSIPPDGFVTSLDSRVSDIWSPGTGSIWVGGTAGVTNPYFHGYHPDAEDYIGGFRRLLDYRRTLGARLVYSVMRLDGPSPEVAKALVDKALFAEAHGLRGLGCFDRLYGDPVSRFSPADYFTYGFGDLHVHAAAEVARAAALPVVEDPEGAEFGTAPAPLRCDNAALYVGWYAFNHYNDAFSWAPGAIGYHIDSASAVSPRSGPNWAHQALRRGITVTSGAVNEPYVPGIANAGSVFGALVAGGTVGEAFLRGSMWLKWVLIHMGDPLYRPFPTGPEVDPPPPPPSGVVRITSPIDGAVVWKHAAPSTMLTADVSAPVARVVFSVDGRPHCTDRTAPYTCRWHTPNAAGWSRGLKSFAVTARALSTTGALLGEHTIAVLVSR